MGMPLLVTFGLLTWSICPLCPLLFSRPLLLLARAKARRLGLDSTSSFSFSTSSSLKPRIGAFRQELGRFLLARARGPERRLLHTSASPWNRPDPRHHQDRTWYPDYTEHVRVPAPLPSSTTRSPSCSSHPRHGHDRTRNPDYSEPLRFLAPLPSRTTRSPF